MSPAAQLLAAIAASPSARLLADVTLKATLVIALAWVAERVLLRRASAAARHWLWTLTLTATLLAPLASTLLPAVAVVDWAGDGGATSAAAPTAAASAALPSPAAPGPPPSLSSARPVTTPHPLASTSAAGDALAGAFGLWLVGCGLLATRALAELYRIGRSARRGIPATGPWRRELELCRRRLGVTADVSLRLCADIDVPIAAGVRRSHILLPERAAAWTTERRRVVLIHELAHIARADARVNLLAQLACAFLWHNPLVWVARRRLRLERERACDDRVLGDGTDGPDYAQHLLAIARELGARVRPRVDAVGMAHRSELEQRLIAILGDGARTTPSRRSMLVSFALVVAAATPLAAVQLLPRTPPLEELAAAMFEGDAARRREAAYDLGGRGREDAIPVLRAGTADPEPAVRRAVIYALGAIASRKGFGPTFDALDDPHGDVREAAVWSLGQIGCRPAFLAVAASLGDADARVRAMAARSLARFDRRLARRSLAELYAEQPPGYRRRLGPIQPVGAATAVSRLTAALNDETPEVRQQAAAALRQLGLTPGSHPVTD